LTLNRVSIAPGDYSTPVSARLFVKSGYDQAGLDKIHT
jgi:hypothetical protein